MSPKDEGREPSTSEQVRRNAEAVTSEASRKVQSEVRKAEGQIKDTIRQVERTVDELSLSEPTPAKDADEAKAQAEQLRSAIGQDLDTLQRKLPPGEELSARLKTIGGVVAGIAAAAAALSLVAKKRGETKQREAEAEANARAIARYLPQVLGTTPTNTGDEGGGGGRKLLALFVLVAGGAAAWFATRDGDDEPDIWGPAT
ncbi:hypothetical protein FTX61_13005 [Nitriliruptoraceae bacterium ZYF776]|nr:hypothetical protein [Profundirhabdus halotolerans]